MALNFPSSPANGATFEGYIYNSTTDTWDYNETTPDSLTLSTFRLTSTTDITTSSTTHAFQIGADAALNMRIDNNEIQALNNGAVSALNLNNGGGTVNIGAVGGSNLVVNGGLSLAQQRNALVVSGYNSASGSFAHASKVIMSANATASAAPTLRPDGTSLAAGDVWISW
jgi:hypothetical protein